MMKRIGIVALMLGVCATLAVSQQPPRVVRDVVVTPTIGQPEIQRVRVMLQAIEATKNNPGLLKQLTDLVQNNPGKTPEQLANEFLGKNPSLNTPEGLKQFEKLAEGLQASAPPKSTPGTTPAPISPNPPPPSKTNVPNSPTQTPTPTQTPAATPTQNPETPMVGGQQPVPPVGSNPPTAAPMTSVEPMPPPVTPATNGQPNGTPTTPQTAPTTLQKTAPKTPATPPATTPEDKQFQAVAGWWEKNVGPLKDTPAIKDVLTEFVKGAGSTSGKSPLSEIIGAAEGNDKGSFGKWVSSNLKGNNWNLPEMGKSGGNWKTGAGNFTAPNLPSASVGFSFGDGDTSWTPVILLGLFVTGSLLGWWLWPKITGRSRSVPTPLAGLGPWPIDPRKITNRENLIVAFEYLSVLSCGYGAKNWNHVTIANELRRVVPEADPIADELGELYALARYTPAEETLPVHVIPDARRFLCELAGVRA